MYWTDACVHGAATSASATSASRRSRVAPGAADAADRVFAAADGLGNRKVSAEEIKRLLAARVKGK